MSVLSIGSVMKLITAGYLFAYASHCACVAGSEGHRRFSRCTTVAAESHMRLQLTPSTRLVRPDLPILAEVGLLKSLVDQLLDGLLGQVKVGVVRQHADQQLLELLLVDVARALQVVDAECNCEERRASWLESCQESGCGRAAQGHSQAALSLAGAVG